ncbi:uncharacterized protein LOC105837006 [Monomorium pharaonis]|uniref:uncharacterized protein LOC105837006 n=1 Tax=Monomorium pharaonis TaxID=307658 RepID=UPI00063F9AF8|nr:uncharacterized protein LOC105837006 [Monomorium pharaonis]
MTQAYIKFYKRGMLRIKVSALIPNVRNDSQPQTYVNINVTKSKLLPRCFMSMILSSLITMLMATPLIIYQLDNLQTQINSLMSMYQDNNESNHVNASNRFRRSVDYNDPVSPVTPSTLEHSNETEVRDDRNSHIIMSKSYNQPNFLRTETQNYTMQEDETSRNRKLISWSVLPTRRMRRNQKDSEKRQNEKKDEKHRQNKEKVEKQGQNDKENKKRLQNRRGRKHKRSRPLVATFIGAVSESKNTVIGPWLKKSVNHKYDFTKFHLVDNNMAIQIGISGLYIISVQIYYIANVKDHSYWVLLNSEGASTKQRLVTCSTASLNAEVSCYTSLTMYLKKGDRLSVLQQQKDRFIKLEEGYSQIQITLLDKDRRAT